MKTREITADEKLIAYCGLYCGACRAFLKGSCPGCSENNRASWCKIRSCCINNSYANCSACQIDNYKTCTKLNNFISRIFALVFKSNRSACLEMIKEKGASAFSKYMAENKIISLK
ncbi:MAG: hypothetical protein A2096_08285 [Spirochaetes bacterium GWF1_41_5]|nr:MAG: hypothetical protein A2096_08285 [Spirochaetes bacterium GWF1_41_5]